ncbi:restriction endonuclease subunit S [Trichococcus alkaliphilus]|uniref:restriction endonuclease subunit S n=1 Tax=Trichococcus alkaliphilus TaxID=2052943 RepID=UPI000D0B8976|nr:restriction endonuclease subunit S [Trichococcus alkaliphilus]
MSSKKHKTPTIRFKGFADTWEQRKLGEVGSVVMCKRIFKDQTTAFGDIPFYKIGTFGGSPDSFIPNELFEEYKKNYPYPEIGDILMSASGTIGRTVVYEGEKAYYQDSNIVWLKTDKSLIDNSFLKQFYQVVKWSGLEGSTIKRLYNSNILSTGINLPPLEEQTKLGTFFNQLDITIALHQRQLYNYKELKKAMLQKIFNQELRFKDDDGNDYPDWREITLEEICLYKSSNISLDSFKEYNGEEIYPLYDANSLVLNIDKYDQENEYVSIIKDGAGVGRIRYCKGKSSVLGTMGYLLPTDTVDIKFLYFRLQIINFLSYVSGSTIPHIYFKDYKKENIRLPCEDEQKKIADVLSALDIKIEISIRKIEALKQQKKGLMQQMFV